MLKMLSSERHQLLKNTDIRGFVRMLYNAFGANLVPRLVPTWCQDDFGDYPRRVILTTKKQVR